MSWEETEKLLKDREDNKPAAGKFFRLKDGEKAVIVFRGEPISKQIIWVNGKSENFDPKVHEGNPSMRIICNVFNMDTGMMQIGDFSGMTWQSVLANKNKHGLDTAYELARTGTGTDTRYNLMFEKKLEEDDLKKIQMFELHKLYEPTSEAGPDETVVPF